MSDDILKQAELRQQRRPKSRQNEEVLTVNTEKLRVKVPVNLHVIFELHVHSDCMFYNVFSMYTNLSHRVSLSITLSFFIKCISISIKPI